MFRLHCRHLVANLRIPRHGGSVPVLRMVRVLIRGADFVFVVVLVPVIPVVPVVPVAVVASPDNVFLGWWRTILIYPHVRDFAKFPCMEVLQFVYIMLCFVNDDVWSLEFGCICRLNFGFDWVSVRFSYMTCFTFGHKVAYIRVHVVLLALGTFSHIHSA